MNEIIFMFQNSLDDGLEAFAVGYSIFSEAESMDVLKKNIIETFYSYSIRSGF
ncbi:MAG: hypothetical protein K9J16_08825 [Melioribacteraceae bacterium]|nr:hypothetical protein [Melioribacteraceae bacterium]MCF8353978.1 hypothetical protein [Melioribacteraceae bacterium]MCF8393706.1 hypothetical protein [Melioribacteraceae bacterium]MCF8419552.1 hypothetical protein [Melioribacteraceae bacterium]